MQLRYPKRSVVLLVLTLLSLSLAFSGCFEDDEEPSNNEEPFVPTGNWEYTVNDVRYASLYIAQDGTGYIIEHEKDIEYFTWELPEEGKAIITYDDSGDQETITFWMEGRTLWVEDLYHTRVPFTRIGDTKLDITL